MRVPLPRRGTAIVAALALVALAGALLATAAAQSTASAHGARAERDALVIEGAARHAIAEALAHWPSAADSLPVGAFADRHDESTAGTNGLPLRTRLRIQRVATSLWSVTVEVRLASDEAMLARRRLRLLVRRPAPPDSGAVPPPVPIARWALADLY